VYGTYYVLRSSLWSHPTGLTDSDGVVLLYPVSWDHVQIYVGYLLGGYCQRRTGIYNLI